MKRPRKWYLEWLECLK